MAEVLHPNGESFHFDLQLTARSSYQPFNSTLNGLINSCFARINLDCNQEVDLRVTMVRSHATAPSCNACFNHFPLDEQRRIECFAAGCACYGTTVYNEADCSGSMKEEARARYPSALARPSDTVVLPPEAMVSMTVYDFDTGPNFDYLEQLKVPEYAYYVKPLRPASGDEVISKVFANEDTRTFTGSRAGMAADNPTDPQQLTNEQAEKGIQFFFRPQGASHIPFRMPTITSYVSLQLALNLLASA